MVEETSSPKKKFSAKKLAAKKPAAEKVAPINNSVKLSQIQSDELVSFYEEMMLVRRFEERAARSYTQALIGGYCHLNLGEEAAIAGLLKVLNYDDYLFTNYREHGYALLKGIDAKRLMAELYGRVDGVSKGWGARCTCLTLNTGC